MSTLFRAYIYVLYTEWYCAHMVSVTDMCTVHGRGPACRPVPRTRGGLALQTGPAN